MFSSNTRRLTRPSGRSIPLLTERLDERQRRILLTLASGEASVGQLENGGKEAPTELRLSLAHLAELELILVLPGESCWRLSHDGRQAVSWLPERV